MAIGIPKEIIERKIYLVRTQRVMIDADLALLYGVPTHRLVEAVKRNVERFPRDFMFQMKLAEWRVFRKRFEDQKSPETEEIQTVADMRSQIAISCPQDIETTDISGILDLGGRRTAPYCFTEQGVAMLSAVLRSPKAISVSIEVVRTFVQLRKLLSSNTELASKLTELEEKYDAQFRTVFEAIRTLMNPTPAPEKRKIGFGRE